MLLLTLAELRTQSAERIGTLILSRADEAFVCHVTPDAYAWLAQRAEAQYGLSPQGAGALHWLVEGVRCRIVAVRGAEPGIMGRMVPPPAGDSA